MGHAVEVAQGILRVEVPLGERLNALYLLSGDDTLLLMDTGTVSDPPGPLTEALVERGAAPAQIRFVVNSHADVDHMGGNRSMRALAPGAILVCGESDRAMIEDVEHMIAERYGEFGPDHGIDLEPAMADWCRAVAQDAPIDVGLVGGEHLRLGEEWSIDVVHTPGHSRGSISLWDPRSRSLIIGDAVLGASVKTALGRPAFPPTYRYVDDYVETIDRLAAMDVDVLLAGHEVVMRGPAVTEFLALSREFVARLEAAMVGAVRAGPWTLADLALELGPRLGDWPADAHPLMRFPLLGHLERMVARGEATAERIENRLVYRWAAA